MTVDCSLHIIIMTIFLVHRAGGCSMLPLLHVSIAAMRSRLRLSQEWGSQHLEKKAFPYVVRWRHLTITDIRRISCYFVSKCCLQYLFLVLDGVGRNQLTVNLLPKLSNGGAPNLTFQLNLPPTIRTPGPTVYHSSWISLHYFKMRTSGANLCLGGILSFPNLSNLKVTETILLFHTPCATFILLSWTLETIACQNHLRGCSALAAVMGSPLTWTRLYWIWRRFSDLHSTSPCIFLSPFAFTCSAWMWCFSTPHPVVTKWLATATYPRIPSTYMSGQSWNVLS